MMNQMNTMKTPKSPFQYELEQFDMYMHELNGERSNILEIEMYSDLIKKCFTFGEMMKKWMDNETEDLIPVVITGLRNTGLFSDRMSWKIDKIDIVLERIIQMMIDNIYKRTSIERQLIEQDISVELTGLAKRFLWLVLQDQKRYEMLFPTGKEMRVNDHVEAMSYIDKQPAEWKYCTNIVRCIITKEMEAFLSSHIAHGVQPPISPESILSRSSCILHPSLAKLYAKSLNSMLSFLKEANVKIETHKMDPECLSPAQVPKEYNIAAACPTAVFDEMDPEPEPLSPAQVSKEYNRAAAIPGVVFDEIDPEPEPLPPAQASLYNFRNMEPRIPGPGFNYSDSDSVSSSESTETPVLSIDRIEKENKASLWAFIEILVSRILRKAKIYKADVDFEAIVMGLFEKTWLKVEDVEFIPTPEPFHELDKAIFNKLCKKWGSVVLVLESIQVFEPVILECIASLVKDQLLTPPRKRNIICRFCSSVGHCFLKVVDTVIPGSVFYVPDREPLTPIPSAEIYTDEGKKESVRVVIETLVTRILQKAKVYKANVDFDAIVMGLTEKTWLEVQDIDFVATAEEFDELDKVIFHELCNKWSSVALVLEYIQLIDPVIGKCIANSVKHHLLTPPKKRNKICHFFSSVGHCLF